MNVETSPTSLSVADDFALVQQFRKFVQWWINLDETPLTSNPPQAERKFEARSELPILTYYGKLTTFTIRVHRKPTEWCGVHEFVMRLESILDTLNGRDLFRRSRKSPQQSESGPTAERVGFALKFDTA